MSTVTTAEAGTNSGEYWCWQVPPDQIPVWGMMALPQIKKMSEALNGELRPEDILDLCIEGTMQLFLIQRGKKILSATITEFVLYPRKKVLRIICIAGERLLAARKFWPGIVQWAEANDAEAIETFATDGTIKWDESLGMRKLYTLMRLDLRD